MNGSHLQSEEANRQRQYLCDGSVGSVVERIVGAVCRKIVERTVDVGSVSHVFEVANESVVWCRECLTTVKWFML